MEKKGSVIASALRLWYNVTQPKGGDSMAKYVTLTSDKSRRKAFWICLLFGIFGGHYFYVGRVAMGVVAFCTVDFFMLGWIYDLWRIRRGKFTDNVGAPLRQ